MRVKICGLRGGADVEKAIELGADAVGFVFDRGSPRCVDRHSGARRLALEVEPIVTTVAVYGKYDSAIPQDNCSLVQALAFPMRAVSQGAPDTSYMLRLAVCAFRFPVGKTGEYVVLEIPASLKKRSCIPRAVLIDGYSALALRGTGVRTDWGLAVYWIKSCDLPVILAGGLTPDSVGVAVQRVQ